MTAKETVDYVAYRATRNPEAATVCWFVENMNNSKERKDAFLPAKGQ